MKTLKPAHVIFINGMVTHRNRIRAYMEAYPRSSASSAKANACRLMKNPAIRQHIDLYYKIEEEEKDREYIEQVKRRFTDFIERQEPLWRIANGYPVQKKTAAGQLILAYPSLGERLAAITTALGNEKRFLREYPEYTPWLKDESKDDSFVKLLYEGDDTADVQNGIRGMLAPRQQRLSIYLRDVAAGSLYRKSF